MMEGSTDQSPNPGALAEQSLFPQQQLDESSPITGFVIISLLLLVGIFVASSAPPSVIVFVLLLSQGMVLAGSAAVTCYMCPRSV